MSVDPSKPKHKILATASILNNREKYIRHIPQDLPHPHKQNAEQLVHKSLDALKAGDGEESLQNILALLEIMREFPDAGGDAPGPGHNMPSAYWGGCGRDCGLDGLGGSGSIWGPATYATCYWSCVAANALG